MKKLFEKVRKWGIFRFIRFLKKYVLKAMSIYRTENRLNEVFKQNSNEFKDFCEKRELDSYNDFRLHCEFLEQTDNKQYFNFFGCKWMLKMEKIHGSNAAYVRTYIFNKLKADADESGECIIGYDPVYVSNLDFTISTQGVKMWAEKQEENVYSSNSQIIQDFSIEYIRKFEENIENGMII